MTIDKERVARLREMIRTGDIQVIGNPVDVTGLINVLDDNIEQQTKAGGATGLGKTNAPESYVGPVSKNLTPATSPGLSPEDERALSVFLHLTHHLIEPYDTKKELEAFAHIKARLLAYRAAKEEK